MKSHPFFLSIIFLSLFSAANVFAQAVLLRHYDFEGTTLENPVSPNLADADGNFPMRYVTEKPWEIVQGEKRGSRAVRLDSGWFEAEAFPVTETGFSVEMRVKILGLGTETGNSGSRNGTLFGLSDGYNTGTRFVLDCNHWQSHFAIGRNPHSIGADIRQPFPQGVWVHLTATWDGKMMMVYLNGIPYAQREYAGEFIRPNWGFRVGYNNAGVGSVKMDVDEVSVYSGALTAAEVFAHAISPETLTAEMEAAYLGILKALESKDWEKAENQVAEWISRTPDSPLKSALRVLQAEIAISCGHPEKGVVFFTEIARDTTVHPKIRQTAMRRCVPTDTRTPLVVADSGFYETLLTLPNLSEEQKTAIQKCIILALHREKASLEKVSSTENLAEKLTEKLAITEKLVEVRRSFGLPDEILEMKETLNSRMIAPTHIQHYQMSTDEVWSPVVPKHPLGWNPVERNVPTVSFVVAPDGSAENPGTMKEPFATLTQARDAIRKLRAERREKGESELPPRGIGVVVRGGFYEMRESFVLEAQDSGTAEAPIFYMARLADKNKPVFSGSVPLTGFQKVTDPDILRRLPEESHGKVYQLRLADHGLTADDLPPLKPRGFGANGPSASPWPDLYVNDEPLTLARYPNEPDGIIDDDLAFIRAGEILSAEHKDGADKDTGAGGRANGVFRYLDPRHDRWAEAEELWLYGYWQFLWAGSAEKAGKLDTDEKSLTVITGGNPYGYAADIPYYAFNLLEEIDLPGEWYLNRETGILYVYPPEGVDLNAPETKVRLPLMKHPFIQAKDVSHTTFLGLTFEDGCGNGAAVSGGERFWFAGCTFQRMGNWGISMHGKGHGVLGCDVLQLGGGGVSMNGGEMATLTPGECFIENSHIAYLTRVDRVYGPAVSLDGVGNRVAHNLMHHSPAHGMRMAGFDNLIEFNEIHSFVYESDDQSGIDMYGNPTLRGNILRWNYWHHIGSGRSVAGQAGIRLDDMISGVLMYGNVFYRSSGGHFGGIQIHGGKDNLCDSNLFIDCKYAFSFSPWGQKRWQEYLDAGHFANMVRATGVDITKEPFTSRYPDLAEIRENADRNFIFRNIAVGSREFAFNEHNRNVLWNNLNLPPEPIQFDALNKPIIPRDWPAYQIIQMNPLPIPLMGLYADPLLRPTVPRTEPTHRYVPE